MSFENIFPYVTPTQPIYRTFPFTLGFFVSLQASNEASIVAISKKKTSNGV
jgi:hypothetical protein